VSGRSARENRRQAIAQARKAEAQRKRRMRLAAWGGAAVVLAGVGTGIGFAVPGGGSSAAVSGHYAPLSTLGTLKAAPAAGAMGPERVPIPGAQALAGTSATTAGQAIDGVSCQTSEQAILHVHTHLTIFVNGQQRQVPAGIGIPHPAAQPTSAGAFIDSGSCFYWLHTHAADGIIHVESPVHRTFTLGDFFDVWGQPLSATQLGPAKGKVTAIVNGKVWQGNPRDVPLGAHENLQLEVGTPLVAPETTNWSITGL
jgi:hypothetical protein